MKYGVALIWCDVQTVHINYLAKKFEDFKCVIRSNKSQDTIATRKMINNRPKNTTQKTGRFSMKIADFVPIRKQTWLPRAILFSDWPISKKSSPLKPLVQMTRSIVGSIYGRFSIQIVNFVPIR